MEYVSVSEIFLVIAGVGIFVMTVIASTVLLYALTLIRSAKRIARSLEDGVELMKHDIGSIRNLLAGKSGALAAMLYKFVEGYIAERTGAPKKKAPRKKARKIAKKKVA